MKTIKLVMLALLSATLTSCGQIGALLQPTDHFLMYNTDNRIFYEAGALDIATQVTNVLDKAVQHIETEHDDPFAEPILIYICANKESFAKHTGLNKEVKAAVFNKKIFLSASLRRQPARIPSLVTHELSHLHIVQRIGTSKYIRHIPSWLSEGLAVHVSNEGGAEYVSETEASRAILYGASFYPDSRGGLLFPKTASAYKLKPHMFYRQSAMFIRFLKHRDPIKFKNLLKNICHKIKFKDALRISYREGIDTLWDDFKKSLSRLKS